MTVGVKAKRPERTDTIGLWNAFRFPLERRPLDRHAPPLLKVWSSVHDPGYLWPPRIGNRMKHLLYLSIAIPTLAGCSTELDINAPYKDITIVYGLLNMRDSVHYVKINKAFLGEGDAYVYAQIPDSNEWGDGVITSAKVYRVLNGDRIDTFPLYDTLITDRLPGTFYSPDEQLFYFKDWYTENMPQNGIPVTMHLDEDSEYDLELVVKGQTLSASTTIVNDFSFQPADQVVSNPVNLITVNGLGEFELNWSSDRDGKRYVADYRFNYREVQGTDTTDRFITQRLGNDISANSSSSESMSVVLDGAAFYSTIATLIPDDPTVDKRIFTGMDFIVSVANDEFHTFLTLSEPISGIIEDRPSYSNVTNGYGIFAGRYVKTIYDKALGALSLQELVDGNQTANLRFCSSHPNDFFSPYYCP